MTNTGDVIPSAQSTGFQSFAFGGKRFDKYNDSTKSITRVSGNQSFAAGGGVEVTGNFAAAFCKQSGAYQEACFAVNGAKAGDPDGNGDAFVAAAAFNSSNVKGIQCSGFGAAQIDSTSKNTVGSGTVSINKCEGSLINGVINSTVNDTLYSFVNACRGTVQNVHSSLIHISDGDINPGDVTIKDSVIMSYNDVIFNKKGMTFDRVFCIGESNTVVGEQTYIFGRGLTSTTSGQVLLGNFNADSNAPVVIGCGQEAKKVSGIELYNNLCKIKTDKTEITGTLKVKEIDVGNNDFQIKGSGKLSSQTEVSDGSLKVSCATIFNNGLIIGASVGNSALHCNDNANFWGLLRARQAPVADVDVVRLKELSAHTDNKENPHEVTWDQVRPKEYVDGELYPGSFDLPTQYNGYINSNNLLVGGLSQWSGPDNRYTGLNCGDSSTPIYFKDGVPETCSLRNIKTKNITTTANIVDSGLSVNNVILSIWYSSEAGSWKVHQLGYYYNSGTETWYINRDANSTKYTFHIVYY